jgi:Helix-turn-helix.
MKEKDKVRLQKIGANLLRIRTAKGLTQEELSYRCDVDRAKISKIESGQVNLVVTTLLDLAEGLEVDPF